MLMPSVTNIEHLQLSRTDSNGKEKASILTTVRTRYTFVDGESGDSYSCDWAGDGEDSLDKGIYKGYTGSEKSFLIKVFLIPTCKDPERPSPQQRQGGNQAQRSNNQPRNNQARDNQTRNTQQPTGNAQQTRPAQAPNQQPASTSHYASDSTTGSSSHNAVFFFPSPFPFTP